MIAVLLSNRRPSPNKLKENCLFQFFNGHADGLQLHDGQGRKLEVLSLDDDDDEDDDEDDEDDDEDDDGDEGEEEDDNNDDDDDDDEEEDGDDDDRNIHYIA
ncbi:hypothetical protein R6Q59_013653 [Mikania micrantha]